MHLCDNAMVSKRDKTHDSSHDVLASLPEDEKKIVNRFLIILCAIVFTIEMAVMMLLHHVIRPSTALTGAIIDSVLVAVIVYPLLYLLCINPLLQKATDRRKVERAKAGLVVTVASTTQKLPGGLLAAAQAFHTRLTGQIRSAEYLRETEERYRILFEQSLDGILIVDPETTLPIAFNDTACRQLGYSREEFSKRRIADHDTSETPEGVARHVEEALKGRNVAFETRHRRRDGEIRNVKVIIQPMEESGKTVLSMIFRDITEARHAEEKITRLRRVHTVLSRINEAIIRTREIGRLYEDACRIAVEDGLFKMAWVGLVDADSLRVKPVAAWGYEAGYLDTIRVVLDDSPEGCGPIGMAIRQREYYICNDVNADPRMMPWRDEALKRGYGSVAAFPLIVEENLAGVITFYASEPGFFDAEEVALLRRLASNLSFALESIGHMQKHQQAEKALIKARDELELRVAERTEELASINEKLQTEIIERKQAEERLKLLLKVFESAANSLVITDEEGMIEWVNPAFTVITGYSAEEVVGQNPRLLKSDRHDEVFYKNLWDTIRSGRVWQGEIVNRRKDGSMYVEDMTITPVRNDAGEISHFIAVKQDITERKRVEKIKNEFISIVSHELRTPLTSIRGSLGLMAGGVAGDLSPQAKRLTEIAMRNSERLIRLVNDILDVEKINAGKMVFAMYPHAAAVLIEQALEINRAYGEQYNVEFALENRLDGDARIFVDSDRMLQVLTNLLSNAAKFSPPKGRVVVSLGRHDGLVRISVADRGPGIPEEFQGKIFEAFVQADSSDSRGKGGTGLGLTISRTIVERLGGEIGFITSPGEGTTFYVDLPEWRETPESAEAGGDTGRPRILICEDNREIAVLINTMLQKGGFDTDIAYNTAQAKQLLVEQHYSAMVLDLMLPYQDGISLIRELREDEMSRDLPIVVVSAKAEEGREELGGSVLGVMDWLGKPIDFSRLLNAVKMATQQTEGERLSILHVEDDPSILKLASVILRELATVVAAPSIREAREKLERETFDLVILDLVLPDGSGLELLPLFHMSGGKQVPVVIFTGYEIAEEAMKDAAAVLYKGRTSATDMIEAITSLMKHETVIPEGK